MSTETDFQMKYQEKSAKLEKMAIEFFDDFIGHSDNKANILEISKCLFRGTTAQDVQIRGYVGSSAVALIDFVNGRNHLWRINCGEIQCQPIVFRAAIVDLVASIVQNRNRAPLSEILYLLQTYHRQALPYLPAPSNGNTMEAVKSFILGFPKLFRLVNATDENEWTRRTPLGQVMVECIAVVVDNVILINVAPTISDSPSTGSKSPLDNENTDHIKGIGEVMRITPAWGFLQSENHGPIFFTSMACGGDNLLYKGLKLGLRVSFEANLCPEQTQMFNNVPVKWRAHVIRSLTAAEREDGLKLVNASDAYSNVYGTPTGGQLVSALSSADPTVSPVSLNPPSAQQLLTSAAALKRLPTSLAEWMKKRQEGGSNQASASRQTPSPIASQQRASPMPAVRDIGPAVVQAIEDELESDTTNDDAYTMPYDYRQANHRSDFVSDVATETPLINFSPDRPQQATTSRHESNFVGAAAAENYPDQVDAAVQTDMTDEEMLLRLLRTAPELLDLVRVVMRP